MLFQHQVTEFDENRIESFIRTHCPKHASEILNNVEKKLLMIVNRNKKHYHMLINEHVARDNVIINKEYSSGELKSVYFVCKICVQHIRNDTLPPKSVVNSLGTVFIPEEVRLQSYLEEALISRVLLFIKIFSLRTSLMPAMKDKCIVIPIDSKDISETVEKR